MMRVQTPPDDFEELATDVDRVADLFDSHHFGGDVGGNRLVDADDAPGLVGEFRQFGARYSGSNCDQKAAQKRQRRDASRRET